MLKRYFIMICTALILILCVACENKPASPVEQTDGKFLWNGFNLIRKNIYWYEDVDVSVPENVITTKERNLTISLKSRGGIYEYGFNEFVQVYLDGIWYTFPQELSQNAERLVLDNPQNHSDVNSDRTEYTVDFSVIGKLPPGKYRLVEIFYEERLKEESCGFANFWVIKPGDKRPPESETTGKARKEDIVLSVQSPYEARRDITDKDAWF